MPSRTESGGRSSKFDLFFGRGALYTARFQGGTGAHVFWVARGYAVAAVTARSVLIGGTAPRLDWIEVLGNRVLRFFGAFGVGPSGGEGMDFGAASTGRVAVLVTPGRISSIFSGAGHG